MSNCSASVLLLMNLEKVGEGYEKVLCFQSEILINMYNFLCFTRNLLQTTRRQDEAILYLKNTFGDNFISCDIRLAGVDITARSYDSLRLPCGISEGIFDLEAPEGYQSRHLASYPLSIKMDNNLSPSHTLVQVLCWDHKGLLYDIMRTLKDYNIQVSFWKMNY